MENVKVSIIIPFYNTQEYLKKCLESVVNQTLKEIEIFLIDDCSADNSLEIAQEYAQKDSRIRLIQNKKNSGQGFSRNLGINIAKGQYIAFLDADDFVDLTMYEKLYTSAIKKDADIIKCQFYHIYNDKEEKYHYTNLIKDYNKVYKFSDDPLVLLGQSVSFVWNGMYKKQFLFEKKIKFDEKIKYEDILFHWQTNIEAKKIIFNEESLYFYNRGNEISDTAKVKKYHASLLENLRLIKKIILEKNLQKELANAFILKCFVLYKFLLSPNLNFFQNYIAYKILINILKDFDKAKVDEIYQRQLASRLSLMRFLDAKNYKVKRTVSALKSRFF